MVREAGATICDRPASATFAMEKLLNELIKAGMLARADGNQGVWRRQRHRHQQRDRQRQCRFCVAIPRGGGVALRRAGSWRYAAAPHPLLPGDRAGGAAVARRQRTRRHRSRRTRLRKPAAANSSRPARSSFSGKTNDQSKHASPGFDRRRFRRHAAIAGKSALATIPISRSSARPPTRISRASASRRSIPTSSRSMSRCRTWTGSPSCARS